MSFRVILVAVVFSFISSFGLNPAFAQELPQPMDGNCCGCNGKIKFREKAKPDMVRVGTRVHPVSAMNPFDEGFTFVLSNGSGTLFSETLAAGAVTEMPNGRRWVYKNSLAPSAGGIYSVTVQEASGSAGGVLIYVRAYADLSSATEAEMTTRIVIGTDSFVNTSDWNPRKNGWRHTFW